MMNLSPGWLFSATPVAAVGPPGKPTMNPRGGRATDRIHQISIISQIRWGDGILTGHSGFFGRSRAT